jgi:hypothetical protein
MVPVRGLVTSIRFILKEMQGAQYSDYEIIEALNQSAALLYDRLASCFNFVAAKKAVLLVEDGSVSLPPDFHNIRALRGEFHHDHDDHLHDHFHPHGHRPRYRILGGRLHTHDGTHVLEYYYVPLRVAAMTDNLDVAPSVRPYIEEIAAAVLAGAPDKAEEIAVRCHRTLGGGDIDHYSNMGPVQIWGGRA